MMRHPNDLFPKLAYLAATASLRFYLEHDRSLPLLRGSGFPPSPLNSRELLLRYCLIVVVVFGIRLTRFDPLSFRY